MEPAPAKKTGKRDKRRIPRFTKETAIILAVLLLALLVWRLIEDASGGQTAVPDEDLCEIVMIDVGQGDAFLIRNGKTAVMIDTGPSKGRDKLRGYLDDAGIGRLDCLILTHPHEDHIGNAAFVINNYGADRVIMPDAQTNTYCFERLLKAVDRAGLGIDVPATGDVYEFGDIKLTVLFASDSVPDGELNLYSPIIRLDFGGASALFTGDAEKWNESEVLKLNRAALDCDILKVGHHGSDTSNSDEFIAAVSPSIGLISCEKGNEYGHPHTRTMRALKKYGVTVLRTDLESTVTVVTDGTGWKTADEKAG